MATKHDGAARRDELTDLENRHDTDGVIDRTAAPDDDDVETGFDVDSVAINTGHTDVHDGRAGRGD